MKTKTILLITLIFCIAARAVNSFPLDNSYPAGTDTSIHVSRSWVFEKFGLVKWNYYEEGGLPQMNFYAPLSYILTSFVGKFFGTIIAYKIIIDFFFIIASIAFFFLLKEFGLDDRKSAIAILFFSLTPVYPYYVADGRFATVVSFTFAIVAWLFLKKSLDKKGFKEIFISALSFSAAILSSQIIGFMSFLIIFLWLIFHRFDVKNLKKFICISSLALLFSAWWLAPYAVDTINASSGSQNLFIKKPDITNFKNDMLARIGFLGVFVSDWAAIFIFAFLSITAVLCLVSLTQIKFKTNREFILLAVAIVAMSFILSFKRIFIFLPIPLSIVVAYGAEKLKGFCRISALAVLVLFLILSFFVIRPNTIYNPVFPQLPKDGRFIFLGNETKYYGDVVYRFYYMLSTMQGNENIQGWYASEQQSFGYSSLYSMNKLKYGNQLLNFSEANRGNYYDIMKDGWVNYIVFDNDDTKFIRFFNSSKFRIYSKEGSFTILEIVPKVKYVQLNGEDVDASFEKGPDVITINMACNPGKITVKERFDKGWVASVNGMNVAVSENEYGFMEFENSQSGPCKIVLTYEYQEYQKILLILSVASLAVTTAYFLYDLKSSKRRPA